MSPSPESVGFSTERLRRITTYLQSKIDGGDMPGMIATIARRGQTAYYQKFGHMDREAQTPMRDDALFIIASMTKPVTSVALMTLYEEGHFHLNTPVHEFIPAFRDSKVFVRETDGGMELEDLREPITFRHLFTHTAGLCYGGERDAVDRLYAARSQQLRNAAMTNEKLVQELAGLPLAFQPGTHWRYSFAIDVLGRLVEVISGQPLDVFMQERLFKPLGMVDTAFYVPPEKVDRVATVYGHTAPDPELKRMDPIKPRFERPSWISGGGGLVSTAHDYGRFAQMLVNGGTLDGNRILGPRTVALYSMNMAPQAALPYGFRADDSNHRGYGYSLGTRVLMDVAANGIDGSVGEFGWDGAHSTYFWVDPKEALYGLLMMQHNPNQPLVHQRFKQLTYQALVG